MRSMLVTGAAGGIGRAIAERASAAGYRVGVLDLQADATRAASATIANAVPLVANVSDEAQVEAALDAFGACDVWVSNAGIVRFGPLAELPLAEFRAAVDVNLVGTFVGARAAAKRMIARGHGGAIVNITSMNGVVAGPTSGAYAATKAGVALLTQHLALALGPRGVRVNAVGPGFIDAGMSAPIYADPAARAARSAAVPLRSLGEAGDVASVVAFLLSDGARYVTGQHMLVDGGVSFSLKDHLPRKAPERRDGR